MNSHADVELKSQGVKDKDKEKKQREKKNGKHQLFYNNFVNQW